MFLPWTGGEREVYLPLSQNEKTVAVAKVRRIQRPYLALLLAVLLSAVFCFIGLYVFASNGCRVAPMAGCNQGDAPLILVSIDGFRYDYMNRGITPHLQYLVRRGIYGPMQPQFPSYTFPNHYSLVTGLYPESHGIVANGFYDSKLKDYFSYTNPEKLRESKWWQAEPIWNTVQRYGKRSAAMFWPGSESVIGGRRPDYYQRYNETVSTEERAEQVLRWLDLPKHKRPDFVALYLSAVDDAGHEYGPESEEVNESLQRVDAGIGHLLQGLKHRKMLESVNLLIVSDHGMVSVGQGKGDHVYLDEMIEDMKNRVKWIDYGPVASIIPLAGQEDSIYSELKAGELSGLPYKVHLRSEIPERFHYRENDRIAPIVLVANKGCVVDFLEGSWVAKGLHGYDPSFKEMQAIFIASGPGFRSGNGRVNPGNRALLGIRNLDVYPLMMHLLKVPAFPNNGTLLLVNQTKQ